MRLTDGKMDGEEISHRFADIRGLQTQEGVGMEARSNPRSLDEPRVDINGGNSAVKLWKSVRW
jgi:hypothetical protein